MTLSADRRGRLVRRVSLAFAVLLLTWLSLASAIRVDAQSPQASPIQSAVPVTSPAPSVSPGASPAPGASTEPCPIPAPTPASTPNPSASPTPAASPTPLPLCPAVLSGDPVSLLAWLFNPIFQTMFLLLVVFYSIFGDIGIAIILLTLLIKTILIPLFRSQIVSQRRMQLLQPEIRAIQQKYKGNRSKISEETMRLYRERKVSLGAGCLPTFLQLFLLLPIYSVISQGLAAPDISSALQFLGQPLLQDLQCQAPGTLQPCIDPTIGWLGNLDAHVPEILFTIPGINFGISLLALLAALLQLVQTRMMTPPTTDPQVRAQQRVFLIIPLFSIIYGSFLPAGLFLYWIVFTAYSIVQQYLIVGWGSLFPLFGWTPGFAQNHTPRFPVETPKPLPGATSSGSSGASRQQQPSRSPSDRAAGTIKPARQRGRTSRRGRRR